MKGDAVLGSVRRSGRRGWDAQAQNAAIRGNAIGGRLAREGALSVLNVAVVGPAGEVVLARQGDRTRHCHLSGRGRRWSRTWGGYGGRGRGRGGRRRLRVRWRGRRRGLLRIRSLRVRGLRVTSLGRRVRLITVGCRGRRGRGRCGLLRVVLALAACAARREPCEEQFDHRVFQKPSKPSHHAFSLDPTAGSLVDGGLDRQRRRHSRCPARQGGDALARLGHRAPHLRLRRDRLDELPRRRRVLAPRAPRTGRRPIGRVRRRIVPLARTRRGTAARPGARGSATAFGSPDIPAARSRHAAPNPRLPVGG